MRRYIAKKIIYALITIYTIATLNFVIFQVLSPVDPTLLFADPQWMSPELVQNMRKLWGLDEPISSRYFTYIVNMFTFNFGRSFKSMRPVVDEIGLRLPTTILLLGTALICTIVVGVPLGILAASRRGQKADVLAIGVGLFAYASPVFFVELAFLLIFHTYLGWFPWGRMLPTGSPPEGLVYIATVAYHMVLPVVALTLVQFGSWALLTRNIVLDSLTQDFIVTARAKGIKERSVLFKHALRATLPPIVTMMALSIPAIFTGSLVTEYIFTWPGVGLWFFESMLGGDYPAVQALFFVFALLTVAANFISDIIYGFLDPRIRVGGD